MFSKSPFLLSGNLSIEENERKLVPVRVWEILKKYFPSTPSLPHDTQPCRHCQVDIFILINKVMSVVYILLIIYVVLNCIYVVINSFVTILHFS